MQARNLRIMVKDMADETTSRVYAPGTIAPEYKPALNRLIQAQALLIAHAVATGRNKDEALKALNSFTAECLAADAAGAN